MKVAWQTFIGEDNSFHLIERGMRQIKSLNGYKRWPT